MPPASWCTAAIRTCTRLRRRSVSAGSRRHPTALRRTDCVRMILPARAHLRSDPGSRPRVGRPRLRGGGACWDSMTSGGSAGHLAPPGATARQPSRSGMVRRRRRAAQQFDQENRQSGKDCRPDGDGRRRVLPEDEHQHGDADDGGFQDPAVTGQPVLPRPGLPGAHLSGHVVAGPSPGLAGQTRPDANGRSGKRPGPSASPRRRQTARRFGAAPGGSRRGFGPPPGETVAGGIVLRKMFSPMASAEGQQRHGHRYPQPHAARRAPSPAPRRHCNGADGAQHRQPGQDGGESGPAF